MRLVSPCRRWSNVIPLKPLFDGNIRMATDDDETNVKMYEVAVQNVAPICFQTQWFMLNVVSHV